MKIGNVARHFLRMFRTLRNAAVSSALIPSPWRWRCMAILGYRVSKSYIAPKVFVGGHGLEVGQGAYINYECFIDAGARVEIGENVALGPRVVILTVTHKIGTPRQRRDPDEIAQAVRIGKGSWIGANSTILPGVVIGEGCVIGAGSVVSASCEPNSVYVGSPARKVRDLGVGILSSQDA